MQIGSYATLNHLWWDTIKTIMHQGNELKSRAGVTKEILGFQATLVNPLNNILLKYPTRKFSLSYACAEVLWFLSGTNKINLIEAYAPQYKNFAEYGIAYGAYGARWAENPGFVSERIKLCWRGVPNTSNQLRAVIHLLKENPNTRQAIMTMWDSGDLLHAIAGDHKDLPCTLTLKFYVRNNKLHLIADMRSNDAWLGVPYDIFCFTTIQRLIAAECKLGLGNYTHQAGSMHIYERNFEKIEKIIERYWSKSIAEQNDPVDNHKFSLQHNISNALNFEEEMRRTSLAYGNFENYLENGHHPMDNLFQDLAIGCTTKWSESVNPQHFYNPIFQEWQRQNLGE